MPEAAISDYFYGDEAEQFIYFRIPRQLIVRGKVILQPQGKEFFT